MLELQDKPIAMIVVAVRARIMWAKDLNEHQAEISPLTLRFTPTSSSGSKTIDVSNRVFRTGPIDVGSQVTSAVVSE